uniref:Uncharacterized protein n=1 Tax=Anguilla anguilla TaxID=7936 RepID=A0A0E9UZ38_ANGAN
MLVFGDQHFRCSLLLHKELVKKLPFHFPAAEYHSFSI